MTRCINILEKSFMFLLSLNKRNQKSAKGEAFGNQTPTTSEVVGVDVYGIAHFWHKRAFLFVAFYMVCHYKIPILLKRNKEFYITKSVRYDALRYKNGFLL